MRRNNLPVKTVIKNIADEVILMSSGLPKIGLKDHTLLRESPTGGVDLKDTGIFQTWRT